MKRQFYLLTGLIVLFFVFNSSQAQPQAPENLQATEKGFDFFYYVELQWDYQLTNTSSRFKFNIYKKEGEIGDSTGFVRIFSIGHHREFYDKFVFTGNTYSYYVTAENQQGESGPSNFVQITLSGNGTIKNSVIAGNVTDEVTGLPLQNAIVSLLSANSFNAEITHTDEFGNFSAKIRPGTYIAHFMAKDYLPEFFDGVKMIWNATKILVAENDSAGNINASLRPFTPPVFYSLSGKVTDAGGNPLKVVMHILTSKFNGHHRHAYRTVTNLQGEYRIHAKEGDTVVVFAKPFSFNYLPEYYNDKISFSEADRIPIAGNVENIDFILEERPVYNNGISGTVRDTSGSPLNARILAFRLGHIWPYPVRHVKLTTISDSTGAYEFSNLIPGYYILLAKPEEGYIPGFFRYDGQQTLRWRLADSVFVDSTGIIADIDFNLLPLPDSGYGFAFGSVRDDAGNPVPGANVYALDENQQISSYSVSDINGMYRMDGLDQGNYKIICDAYGFEGEESENVNINYSNSASQSLEFTLTPDAVTFITDEEASALIDYSLSKNYPNPFNPSTRISYSLPVSDFVTLKVYDILGRELVTLLNQYQKAGSYSVNFNADNLSSCIYIYILKSGEFTLSKKMTLLK